MEWWANQNFAVNLGAKHFLYKCQHAKRVFVPIQLYYEHWAVYCQQVKQSFIDLNAICEKIFHLQTKNYWNTHHCILVPSQCKIDRQPNRLVRKKLSPAKRRFVAKFYTPCVGVGHAHKYRKYQDHSRCPCCGAKVEETDHVLPCPDNRTKKNFKKAMNKILEPALKTAKTASILLPRILNIVFAWRKGRYITSTNIYTYLTRSPYQRSNFQTNR